MEIESVGENVWEVREGRWEGWRDGLKKHFGERRRELAGWGAHGLEGTRYPDHSCWWGEGVPEVLVVDDVILVEPNVFRETH